MIEEELLGRPNRSESRFSSNLFLIILTALCCTFGMLSGDRLAANDGLGWDGISYAGYLQKLGKFTALAKPATPSVAAPDSALADTSQASTQVAPPPLPPRAEGKRGINPYHFHRLAPIVGVHLGLRALHIEHSIPNIIQAFLWLNVISLLLGAFLWLQILDRIGCQGWAKLLGYCALFVSFGSLKMPFYYAVLLDTASFFMAILQLYLHLGNRRTLLWLATLVGAFTHPWLFYLGAILFLVPYESSDAASAEASSSDRVNDWLVWGVVALVTLLPWAILILDPARRSEIQPDMNALRMAAIALGGLLALIYLRLTLRPFIDVRRWLTLAGGMLASGKVRLLIVVVSYFAIELGISALAVGKSAMTPSQVVVQMAWRSVANLLVFAVSHLWYFGPVYLLLILRWRDFVTAVRSLGTGLTLVALILFITLLDSESRRVIVLLPFAGLFLAKALSLRHERTTLYALLAGLSLAFSRMWVTIKIDQPWSGPQFSSMAFPWQAFFMNMGPWLSDRVYLIGTAVLAAVLLLLWQMAKEPASEAQRGR